MSKFNRRPDIEEAKRLLNYDPEVYFCGSLVYARRFFYSVKIAKVDVSVIDAYSGAPPARWYLVNH